MFLRQSVSRNIDKYDANNTFDVLVCEELHKSTQMIPSVQNEVEITLLISEINILKIRVQKLLRLPFDFACIECDESLLRYYTGLGSKAFCIIVDLCSLAEFKYFYDWKHAVVASAHLTR